MSGEIILGMTIIWSGVEDNPYGSFQGRIKLGAYQSPAAGVSAANEMALTEWSLD